MCTFIIRTYNCSPTGLIYLTVLVEGPIRFTPFYLRALSSHISTLARCYFTQKRQLLISSNYTPLKLIHWAGVFGSIYDHNLQV